MKKVFQSAEQTIHVFAQQTQQEGKSANVFFEGNRLYSYGYHFPLAIILTNKKGDKVALINDSSYSNTTTKQQSFTRAALGHYNRLYADNGIMKHFANIYHYSWMDNHEKTTLKGIKDTITKEIESIITNALRGISTNTKQREKTKLAILQIAKNNIARLIKILDFYSLKLDTKTKKDIDSLDSDLSTLTTKYSKIIAAENKAREKEAARRLLEQQNKFNEALPLWLEGSEEWKHREAVRYGKNAWLRLRDSDTIETTYGANFPLDDAKQALQFIIALRSSGKEFVKNGKRVKLGSFEIDSIDSVGNVKAACHFVEWQAIESLAKKLGLI
jgi:hypothetical protein